MYEDTDNSEAVRVHDGFPNPATDSSLQGIDLNRLLVRHGASTYFMRVSGNQWQESGIFDRDLVIVDRAPAPRLPDLVVWLREDEFAISLYSKLKEDSQVFGVVTAVIHQYQRRG